MPQSLAPKTIWYGIGEAIKGQMPNAQAERIGRAIATYIIPRLSENQKQWVKDHAVGISKAIGIAGVATTVGEIALVIVATRKGYMLLKSSLEKKPIIKAIILTPPTQEITNKIRYPVAEAVNKASQLSPAMETYLNVMYPKGLQTITDTVKMTFTQKYHNAYDAQALVDTYKTMADLSRNPTVKSRMHDMVGYLSKNSAERSKGETLFKNLFLEAYKKVYAASLQTNPTRLFLIEQSGKALFEKWKNIQFVQATPLLLFAAGKSFSPESAFKSSTSKNILRAGRVLKNRVTKDFEPITPSSPFDSIVSAFTNTSDAYDNLFENGYTTSARDAILTPPPTPIESYDQARAIEAQYDESINQFKKDRTEKTQRIHYVFDRIRQKEAKMNLKATLQTPIGLGDFQTRLVDNLTHADSFRSLEPKNRSILKKLLTTAHEKQDDPKIKLAIQDVSSYRWHKSNAGTRGFIPSMTPEKRQLAAERFFSTLIDAQPKDFLSTYGKSKKEVTRDLATEWQKDRAGLSVLRSEDIESIVRQIGDHSSKETLTLPWQMRLIVETVKKNIQNKTIATHVKNLMNKGAYRTKDSIKRIPQKSLTELIGQTIARLSPENQRQILKHDINTIVDMWLNQYGAGGLGDIYKAAKGRPLTPPLTLRVD